MISRQSVILASAAALSGVLTAVLFRVSHGLALRSPLIAAVEPTVDAGHVWWLASTAFLLFIGAIAAIYSKNRPSAAGVGVAAALLLCGPLLVFTSDFLAAWVSLSAALAGFYLASCRIRTTFRPANRIAVLLWALLALSFAIGIVGVLWAILFLE